MQRSSLSTLRLATPGASSGVAGRCVAVWFPGDPFLGAAVAAALATVPSAPGVLVDVDADWADAASVVLDDRAPAAGDPSDLLGPAALAASGARVVVAPPDVALVGALRTAGGGVFSLPATLTAAPLAAEADLLVLGMTRNFPALRRARLALDRLPPGRGEIALTVAEGMASDVTVSDIERVLGLPVAATLPPGGRELAAYLERGIARAPRRGGSWGEALLDLGALAWSAPGSEPRRVRRLLDLFGGRR